jgi:hypothetical protein
MGGPLVEQLQRDGLPVKGFMTTNASKEEAVRSLEGAFERGEIRILNDPVLIGELQAFEQVMMAGGKYRFSAPEGMHDDCVISLAIAWQGASAPPAFGELINDIDTAIYKSRRKASVWD